MSKKDKIQKTNVARLLDQAKIEYQLVPYEVDESNLSVEHTAATLGQDPAQVFKTLVLITHGGPDHIVCVVPGGTEIDLKVAAKACRAKKVEMLPMKELLPLTGYIRGGCTAIGMKKPFPVYVDSTITGHDYIYVSAGQRGLQLRIAPADYLSYTGATVVPSLGTPV